VGLQRWPSDKFLPGPFHSNTKNRLTEYFGLKYWWRDVVKEIFAEENLAYEIDAVGGIHPAVDFEFQRNIVSAIAALQSQRYRNVRDAFEGASNHLSADPPNYKQAWRGTFAAVAGLFGLLFPYAPLTVDEVDRKSALLIHHGGKSGRAGRSHTLLGPVTCNTPRQCARPQQVTRSPLA
jgi:hypothetical protein